MNIFNDLSVMSQSDLIIIKQICNIILLIKTRQINQYKRKH